MKTNVYKTAQLGDLVAAVFDEAEQYSSDPREVSRLATRAVTHLLRRCGGNIALPIFNTSEHRAKDRRPMRLSPKDPSSEKVDGEGHNRESV